MVKCTNYQMGLCELKQHKPWNDEEFSHFFDERNRLKCSGYRIQVKAM